MHEPCRTIVALCRASTSLLHPDKKDVDGRDKPGHDEAREFVLFRRLDAFAAERPQSFQRSRDRGLLGG
jgi:hypothetical protein